LKQKTASQKGGGDAKLLLIGDVHEGFKQAELAAKIAEKEDRDVFCAGDYLVDWHEEEEKLVTTFDRMILPFTTGKSKLYTVNGNHDPDAPYSKAIEKHKKPCIDVRGKLIEYASLAVAGFGGREALNPEKNGSGSPHGYAEIYKSLSSNIESAKSKGYTESDIALLIHEPAKGYLDVSNNGHHIGGNAARDIVEKYNVGLVISGHAHTDRGLEVRVREGGNDYRMRLDPSEEGSGEYDFHGAKIIAKGRQFDVSYSPADTALTCFVNPGTLGYSNDYAALNLNNANGVRSLSFDFRKL